MAKSTNEEMIDYSLAMHPNPMNKEAAPKAYAHAQEKQKLDLDQFAEHITSHGCVYSKGDILAILTIAISCIREQILAGNSVELGDLGKFYCSITSKGADSFEDFNAASNIKRVAMKWQPTKVLRNLKSVAEFNRVLTKKDEAEAKKEAYGA